MEQGKGAFAEAKGCMPVSFGWAVAEHAPDCHKMWSAIKIQGIDKHMRTTFGAYAFFLYIRK